MSNKARDLGHEVPSQGNAHFIWPLGKSPTTPDDMNTSFGPRIDADRWDFHDGIDLPAPVGTPVHAMADGVVHRAGPADKTGPGQGFGSTHVLLKVCDPTDGQHDLFLVYLHLDSIAAGVIPGAQVHQGDVIGAVGQEDATYPHLHCEFRKGEPKQDHSVHPLHYLPYPNAANFTPPRLDRCNFYRDDGDKRAVRLCFEALDRREGDLQGVDVKLRGDGVATRDLRVDFDERDTIVSDKGDEHAFKNGIAVEGYQKSNLKGEGLRELHYGVLVKDIAPEYDCVVLQVLDVKHGEPQSAEFPLPTLETDEKPVDSRASFEDGKPFPPQGWELSVLPGHVCEPDEAAALSEKRGLLYRDLGSSQGTLIRAGLHFALPAGRVPVGSLQGTLIRVGLGFALPVASPVRPMSWRLRADIRPAELQMAEGLMIHPLAFLIGDDVVAAACLRKTGDDAYFAGILIRSADGLFRERMNANEERKILLNEPLRWELDLLRLGTRQTTAVLRLDGNVVARINGDTTSVEPDTACVGILHRHSGLQITLHVDQLRLTEAPR
ncbi:MAG TPA: M23 family metallopeptidase [Alphaproteobacteria bacterium]|nr:M23 family metallopeptidase [Alphaproteobacteria bacterium]